jgi:hypothetical protein
MKTGEMCKIEQIVRQETDIKAILGAFPLTGQAVYPQFGDLHAPYGRPRRWLGFVTFSRSELGLAIRWIHRHVHRVDQGSDHPNQGR